MEKVVGSRLSKKGNNGRAKGKCVVLSRIIQYHKASYQSHFENWGDSGFISHLFRSVIHMNLEED